MIQYPLKFTAHAVAKSGMSTLWQAESGKYQAMCAVPQEFDGPGGAFSPEDLFALALLNCFIATFKVYADASNVKYSEIKAASVLVVDKNETGQPVMANFVVEIEITGCEKPDRVEAIVAKAFKSGFILNSVKTKIEYSLKLV